MWVLAKRLTLNGLQSCVGSHDPARGRTVGPNLRLFLSLDRFDGDGIAFKVTFDCDFLSGKLIEPRLIASESVNLVPGDKSVATFLGAFSRALLTCLAC